MARHAADFHDLCQRAATAAGYPDFQPVLVLSTATLLARNCRCIRIKRTGSARANCFCFSGLTRDFSFGGLKRNDPLKRLLLEHGDGWYGAVNRGCFITVFNR